MTRSFFLGHLLAMLGVVVPGPSDCRDSRITIDQVLADPAASFWLKDALRSAMERDPVDAANDAEVLAKLLAERCRTLLGDRS